LTEEYKLQVSENDMLQEIIRLKKDEGEKQFSM
jgi:hypothetical protein